MEGSTIPACPRFVAIVHKDNTDNIRFFNVFFCLLLCMLNAYICFWTCVRFEQVKIPEVTPPCG